MRIMNGSPKGQKLINALLFSFLVIFTCAYARSRFCAPVSFDEEYFIFYGWLVEHGNLPYRDFFEPKPPVIFFANALGLGLFGLKHLHFRIVPTVVVLLTIFTFYFAMLKRRVTPWLSCLLAAQVALWLLGNELHDSGLNDCETYGFAFTVLGFSLGSLSSPLTNYRRRLALQVLGGICFGLAVLSKELFVLSVVPAWLVMARNPDGGGRDWRHLMFAAAGGLAVGVCFLTYLVMHGALLPYVHLVQFYRAFAANYCIDIGIFPRISGFAFLQTVWRKLSDGMYNVNHLAFSLALWASLFLPIRRNRKLAPTKLELTVAAAAVLLGMFAITVGYCFWKHYFLMGTTGLLLLTIMGAESLSRFLSEWGRLASVVLFAVLGTVFFFVAKVPSQVVLSEKAKPQNISWDPLIAGTIQEHSKPGDYILATGGPLIYVSMNRRNPLPTNVFLDEILPYMTAGNPMLSMEILADDLEKHPPKVFYFEAWLGPRQTAWRRLLFDPFLQKYHYVKVDDRLWYLPDEK